MRFSFPFVSFTETTSGERTRGQAPRVARTQDSMASVT